MPMHIKTAVNNAQTYQKLLPIAKELRAELSSWGYQYATITTQSPLYKGTIAVGAVAERAMKIRKTMEKKGEKLSEAEKINIVSLCEEISRLYDEDRINCVQADRATTIYRFIVSILFWVNHQSKWSNSKNGSSYIEQLQKPLSIKLKTAINNAQNYEELLAISKNLKAGLYYWGYQYAYAVPTSSYRSTVIIRAIANKAWEIRHSMERNEVGFNTDEMKNVMLLCKEVFRIYEEDTDNCDQAGMFTTMCRLVLKVIFWMDHQYKWGKIYDVARKTPSDAELLQEDLPGTEYKHPFTLGSR